MKIILASGSPRRKELLTNMQLQYEIVISDCEEETTKTEPDEIVQELSMLKADSVLCKLKEFEDDLLIIAADTLVFLENERLGKPVNFEDAVRMIGELSGRAHKVITGVSLIRYISNNGVDDIEKISFSETSDVFVNQLTNEEIVSYVQTGEPMDKAGAYAIQGLFAKHIKKIDGDYSNVVGLPVSRLYEVLKKNNWI